MHAGEQRSLGELLDDGTGGCVGYVKFKQMLVEGAPELVPRLCRHPPDWSDCEQASGTMLGSSPMRHEVHKLLRHLRGAADMPVLPPAARWRLIGVQVDADAVRTATLRASRRAQPHQMLSTCCHCRPRTHWAHSASLATRAP